MLKPAPYQGGSLELLSAATQRSANLSASCLCGVVSTCIACNFTAAFFNASCVDARPTRLFVSQSHGRGCRNLPEAVYGNHGSAAVKMITKLKNMIGFIVSPP